MLLALVYVLLVTAEGVGCWALTPCGAPAEALLQPLSWQVASETWLHASSLPQVCSERISNNDDAYSIKSEVLQLPKPITSMQFPLLTEFIISSSLLKCFAEVFCFKNLYGIGYILTI